MEIQQVATRQKGERELQRKHSKSLMCVCWVGVGGHILGPWVASERDRKEEEKSHLSELELQKGGQFNSIS